MKGLDTDKKYRRLGPVDGTTLPNHLPSRIAAVKTRGRWRLEFTNF